MKLHHFLSVAAIFAFALTLHAAVRLPAIFSDHAVLAKRAAVPVWGQAAPGEQVTVKFNGQTRTVTAGKDGKFRADLDLSASPAGPFELHVNDKVIRDVAVGEVYLASGQSNMNFRLRSCENISELKTAAANPQIRFFYVERDFSLTPKDDLNGKWIIFSPKEMGLFSGVAYFFAAGLQQKLNVPVGIIQSTIGGTRIESWMSQQSLKSFPHTSNRGREYLMRHREYPVLYKKFLRDNAAWEKKFNRTDTPHVAPPADAKWIDKPARIPGSGIIWLKTTFTISPNAAKKGFALNFKKIFMPTSVWIDGEKVGERVDRAWEWASYALNVPGEKFAPGDHTLMLRIHASRSPVPFRNVKINKSQLKSDWQMYREKKFPNLTNAGKKECPPMPGQPVNPIRQLWSSLYNAMIHPLIPYRLSGVIWYQGESNAKEAWEYGKLFPAMITDWRERFEDKELPFFFCLLAPYRPKNSDPAVAGWGDLRSAQMQALALPKTGMAVLFDAGETSDIHPLDKATPGKRLAAQALAKVYGQNIPCESPVATHAVKSSNRVTIHFDHTYGALTAAQIPALQHVRKTAGKTAPLIRMSPDTQLEGFALCDRNGKWFWADKAEISGDNTVTVSATAVKNPVKVRYCWSNNPTCNLFNRAGFPAAPFEFLLQ